VKLAEQTAAKIELFIVEQGWPLGMVIGSEADLLAEYGVSRAVLREAVRLLEHDNVAHMRRGPGGGLVVAEPDAAVVTRVATLYLRYRKVSPGQLFGARTALELAAVRSATERIDERGIARLRSALDDEAGGIEPGGASHQFHRVVAQLSGNPALELFTDVLTQLSAAAALDSANHTAGAGLPWDGLHRDAGPGRNARPAGGPARDIPPEEVAGTHHGIAEAIIAGDVALAQHRTTRHLQALAEGAGREPAAGPIPLPAPAGTRHSRPLRPRR
jgi:DNA-binding FadR family transcriptional regulator